MAYKPEKHHRRSIRIKGYDYSQPGAYFITICVQERLGLFGTISNNGISLNDPGLMITRWWEELPHKFPTTDIDEYVVMPNHFHGIVILHGDAVGADLRVGPGTDVRPAGPRADIRSAGPGTDVRPAGPGTDVRPAGTGTDTRSAGTGTDVRPAGTGTVIRPAGPGADIRPAGTGADMRSAGPGAGTRSVGPGADIRPAGTGADIRPAGTRADTQVRPYGRTDIPSMVQWFKTMTTNEYIRGVKQSGWRPFPGKLWQRNYYEHVIRNQEDWDRIRSYIANNPYHWDHDLEFNSHGE